MDDIDAWTRLVSALAALLTVLVPLLRARQAAPGWPTQRAPVGANAHPGGMAVYPYCPQCSHRVGPEVGEAWAEEAAWEHSRLTGHVVQLVDADSHVALRSVAGEPSLPLWDKPN